MHDTHACSAQVVAAAALLPSTAGLASPAGALRCVVCMRSTARGLSVARGRLAGTLRQVEGCVFCMFLVITYSHLAGGPYHAVPPYSHHEATELARLRLNRFITVTASLPRSCHRHTRHTAKPLNPQTPHLDRSRQTALAALLCVPGAPAAGVSCATTVRAAHCSCADCHALCCPAGGC